MNNMFCETYDVKTAKEWKSRPLPRYEDQSFWLNINTDSEIIQFILDEADREQQKPIPVLTATSFMSYMRTGHRTPHATYAHARRNRLAVFVMAECIRRDGALIDTITDEIWAICEESSWIAPAHIRVHGDEQGDDPLPSLKHDGFDLLVAMTAESLATALYMMESELHPIVAERIRLELERRVFRPAREKTYKWFYYGSNWTAVCVGGTINAALYAEQDENKLKQLLNKFAPFLTQTYIHGFTPDGGTAEGIGYWNLGFKHYLYSADTLAHATDQQWTGFSDEQVNRVTRFALDAYMGGGQYPTFSDVADQTMPHPWVLNYISKAMKDDEYGSLLNELERYYEQDNVIRMSECYLFDLVRIVSWWDQDRSYRRKLSELKMKRYHYFPHLQWLIIPSKTKGGLQIAMKGGHNGEAHNHNDLGTFIVHSSSAEPFLADLATGGYTRNYFIKETRYDYLETNSFGHNVPRINDQLQMVDKSFHAISDTPELLENEQLQWRVDLRHAYAEEAGIARLERILYADVTSGRSFAVEDHFELIESAGTFESVLYTYADNIDVNESEVKLSFVSGNTLRLMFDQQMWDISLQAVNEELSRARDYPVHRLIFRNKQPLRQGIFHLKGEV